MSWNCIWLWNKESKKLIEHMLWIMKLCCDIKALNKRPTTKVMTRRIQQE